MSVSSTEIAKAAVEFWRQGLDESQVEERLKYTTVYAKISALEFDEAAELMTAATNGMGVSAERVADVWAYLGDASATGVDEIGKAMQKVAAVASNAGISFEQLGAYIAAISEKTRQAPEVIGTALNAIISRLQQVKAKGFKDEDGLGINDIAKALSALKEPIAIMENDEWRAFPDILADIAAQWQDLTDKERAYIATAMGGTRQRNYLLTLLDDLSKSAEGGSRAMKLYNDVLEQNGVAMEKYAIYEESVTAAHARLTAQLEELYSLLSGNVLKGWYDALANIVGMINTATDATGGWNLRITALTALVVAATLAFLKMSAGMAGGKLTAAGLARALTGVSVEAGVATASVSALGIALRAVFAATVVGVAISLLTSFVGWLVDISDKAKQAETRMKSLNDELSSGKEASRSLDDYTAKIKELAKTSTGTAEDIEEFNRIREELETTFPGIKTGLDNEITSVDELTGAYQDLIAAVKNYSITEFRTQHRKAAEGYNDAVNVWNSSVGNKNDPFVADAIRGIQSYDPLNHDWLDDRLIRFQPEAWKNNKAGLAEYMAAYKTQIRQFKEQAKAITDIESEEYKALSTTIEEWEKIYNTEILPLWDEVVANSAQKQQDVINTLLTNMVDPYDNADIEEYLPYLRDRLLNMNWADMSIEEIQSSVNEWIQDYRNVLTSAAEEGQDITSDFIESVFGPRDGEAIDSTITSELDAMIMQVQEEIASYIARAARDPRYKGTVGGVLMADAIGELVGVGASREKIIEIISPFFREVKDLTDDFWSILGTDFEGVDANKIAKEA